MVEITPPGNNADQSVLAVRALVPISSKLQFGALAEERVEKLDVIFVYGCRSSGGMGGCGASRGFR
jgi:hypothetical protein